MHRFDPGAVDLRDVRRVDERERDHAVGEVRTAAQPVHVQGGEPEADHEGDEDQRRPAEEVGVDDHQGAERLRPAPWETADNGDGEREDEHERLRDHHQLQVDLESRPHVGERDPEVVRREERLDNLMHEPSVTSVSGSS